MKRFLRWVLCLLPVLSHAASGDLDTSFAFEGRNRFAFEPGHDFPHAALTQPDGKVVVAGASFEGDSPEMFVIRYTPQGARDTNFGVNGVVNIYTSEPAGIATGLARQSDGKLVVAGWTGSTNNPVGNDFIVARLNTNGTLDASFGTDGIVVTDLSGGEDRAAALAVLANGKILVAGTIGFSMWTVVRYQTNGVLDSTFDGDGIAGVDTSSSSEELKAMLIQSDGSIVLAGSAAVPNNSLDFALARLTSQGGLDTGFGAAGIVRTPILAGQSDVITSLAIQFGNDTPENPDRLVAAGYTYNPATSSRDFAVARYSLSGALDTTFDGDGIVLTDFGQTTDLPARVIVTGIGIRPRKIVVAGTSFDNFAIAQYNSNGSPDTTFDADGKVTTDFGQWEQIGALTLPGGDYLAIGMSRSIYTGRGGLAFARYNPDGTLDPVWDTDGLMTDSHSTFAPCQIRFAATQPDGSIVVAGSIRTTTGFADGANVALARLKPDGMLDTNFGVGGKIGGGVSSSDSLAPYGLHLHEDGRILLMRPVMFGSGASAKKGYGFTRYNTNGTVHNFGSMLAGTYTSAPGGGVVQPDGKIVMAGASLVNADWDFSVVRFTPNGGPDAEFGGGGSVITPMGTTSDSGAEVLLQPGGEILVGGTAGNALALARYHPDGSLDTSFHFDGKVTTAIPGGVAFMSAMTLHLGRILVLAGTYNNNSLMVRYNLNGTLDTTFGVGGIATNLYANNFAARSLLIQPDNKILISGSVPSPLHPFELSLLCVARFNPNGTLDTTYASGGAARHSITGGRDHGEALTFDNSGKLFVGGSASAYFGMVRLHGDELPRLTIGRLNNNVELRWPLSSTGYLLQSTPEVTNSAWSDVPNSRTTNRVIVPGAAGKGFFRLTL